MTEKQLQAAVIDLAELLHYSYYHTHDSRRSVAGFPDMVLVKDRIIFVELKSETGRLTKEQEGWRDDIQAAGGEWYLVRPMDLRWLAGLLKRPLQSKVPQRGVEAEIE